MDRLDANFLSVHLLLVRKGVKGSNCAFAELAAPQTNNPPIYCAFKTENEDTLCMSGGGQ